MQIAQRKKFKKVNQIDIKGNIINTYDGVAVAIERTGIKYIHSAIFRGTKAGGYYWEYVN